MTEREQAAFRLGLAHAADLALITAVTIEVRDDAQQLRQRAAVAALQSFAEALKEQAGEPKGTHETRTLEAETGIPVSLADQRHAAIAAGYTGDPCPSCHAFTMKRAGTCQTCDSCGSTTGCS